MPKLALTLRVVVGLLVSYSGVLAQEKQEPPKETETVALHLLDRGSGARFGDWNVWRYQTSEQGSTSLLLVNTKTGYVVYLPFTSNGWINYRTDKGEWYRLLSRGEADKQDRSDLKIEPYVKKTPTPELELGKHKFQHNTVVDGKKVTIEWTVRVTKDYIDFHCSAQDDHITIRPTSGEIVHNGRSVGPKKN